MTHEDREPIRDWREIPWDELPDAVTREDERLATEALAVAQGVSFDEMSERLVRFDISNDEFSLFSDLALLRVRREWALAHDLAHILPPVLRQWAPNAAMLRVAAKDWLATLTARRAPGWVATTAKEQTWQMQDMVDTLTLRALRAMVREREEGGDPTTE